MQFIENIRLAITSLLANKMRALLTMLGIIIGISAVILITTIGTSIQKTLSNAFNTITNMNYFTVMVDTDSDFLTTDDLIKREWLDELVAAYPDDFSIKLSQNFETGTVRNDKGQIISVSVTGVVDVKPLTDHERGRTINYQDNQQMKNAIYVNDLFISQYFGDRNIDPLGQTINLTLSNGVSSEFTIVGYSKLPASFHKDYPPNTKDIDKVSPINIPYDVALNLFHQTQTPTWYAQIAYDADADTDVLKQELEDFFAEKYAEKSGMSVNIRNMQDMIGIIHSVINVITIAISVIAAISLVVGGVGVMNIMLVSITERTREIGVRKALGAQNGAIRLQFVTEAIMICLIGGIIGIILGIVGGMAIGWIAKFLVSQFYAEYADVISIIIQPSVPAILVAVAFSIMTGVFFGYYPANKAAKMNPIDALRYD